MRSTAQPTDAAARAQILDILRGVALLGILMANSAVFAAYIFLTPAEAAVLPTSTADTYLRYLHTTLIDAKFYSLFSLLFGIGFALFFFTKEEGRGLRLFYRRLLVLALFGLAHSLLLWEGDILLFYAVAGALLPLFRRSRDRALLIWAALLLLSPLLIDGVKVLTGGSFNPAGPVMALALESDSRAGITPQNVSVWLQEHRSYSDMLLWNRSGSLWNLTLRVDSNRLPKVLAMFLIGLVIGRKNIWSDLRAYVPQLRRVLLWGGSIGLLAGIVRSLTEADGQTLPAPAGLLDTLFYTLNAAPLTLAYAAGLTLLHLRRPEGSAWKWLAPVGRMALTDYLLQSLISVFLYYGLGAGLAPVGPSVYIALAIPIYLLQVLYSRWWLSRFQYGPMEWIWRTLTYGKRMPIAQPLLTLK